MVRVETEHTHTTCYKIYVAIICVKLDVLSHHYH